MTRSADWPIWLTCSQFNAIQSLATTAKFLWSVRHEPADMRTAIYGQCERGTEEEINVVLRAPLGDPERTPPDLESRSLVGVYPRGKGFWHGGREPVMVTAVTSATGTADEVLALAKEWAKGAGS